jgi:hypothetical protein
LGGLCPEKTLTAPAVPPSPPAPAYTQKLPPSLASFGLRLPASPRQDGGTRRRGETARQGRYPLWQGQWPMRTFPTTGRRTHVGPGLRWFPSVSGHAAFQRCHPVLTAVKSMCPVRGFRRFRQYAAGDVFSGVVSRTRGLLARVGIHFRAVDIGWNGVLGGGKMGSELNTIRTDK